MPGIHWTSEEVDILTSNYCWNPRVKTLLPNRSAQSIRSKAMSLGLKKDGRGNIETLKADYFDKWSMNTAYILGFFTADGNIFTKEYIDGRTIYRLTFVQKDPQILERICNELGIPSKYITGCVGKIKLPQNTIIDLKDPVYKVAFTSKHMIERLLDLGLMPAKSHQLTKVAVPKKFFSHFLRGYFDGDGCFSFSTVARQRTPRVSFTGGSRNFLKWLEARITNYYNLPNGRLRPKDKDNRNWHLTYRKSTSLKLMQVIYTDFHGSLYLPRKLANYRNYLNYHRMDSSAYETPRSDINQIRYSPHDYRVYTLKS